MKKIYIALLLLTTIFASQAQIADKKTYLAAEVAEMYKSWPNNKTQNLVFHGHSVPTGYYSGAIVKTFDSYPFYTTKALKDLHAHAVLNTIITSKGGENALRGAERFETDVLNYKPNILFIDYSLNDRTFDIDDIRAAWASMIEKALAQNVKVILMTPTPDLTEDITDDNTILKIHADQVKELAAEYHVGLVDSYEIFKQMKLSGTDITPYMAQSNHPNEKGHKLVSNAIMEWFTQLSVDSNEQFQALQISFNGSTGASAAFDYDNDDRTDIIYSDGSKAYVYQNISNDNYVKITSHPFIGVNAGSIVNVDIDNDGKDEIYITGINAQKVATAALYKKNDSGNWVKQASTQGLPAVYNHTNVSEEENTTVVFTDLNGDNYVDFVYNGFNAEDECDAAVYLNNQKGEFTKVETNAFTSSGGGGVKAADFDNDGDQDLVMWGYALNITPNGGVTMVYENDGTGKFEQVGANRCAQAWSSEIEIGDFNNDGNIDFAQISWAPQFFIGDGAMGFTNKGSLEIPTFTRCNAEVLDMNNDGYDDLIIAGLQGSLAKTALYTFNSSLGIYEESVITDCGESGSLFLADLNKDNKIDFFVTGKDRAQLPVARLFYNITETSSVSEVKNIDSPFQVCPNPCYNTINIKGEISTIKSISLIDASGKVVMDAEKTSQLACGNLTKGMYFLIINTENNRYSHSIIKG